MRQTWVEMLWFEIVLCASLAACGSKTPNSNGASPNCTIPRVAAPVPDSGGAGICQATESINVCVIDGGKSSCHPDCEAGTFPLACRAASGSSGAPAPDASLSCKVLALPTAAGENLYCCMCD